MQLVLAHPALRDEYLKTAALIEDDLAAVIAERAGTDRRNVAWPAKSITITVQNALKDWLRSVDGSASADEFPTRPLVWRLRLSLMMFGSVLDGLQSQSR
jgi:hypothetical protein